MSCRTCDSGELVFVYGTLMRGHGNYSYLKDSRFLGKGAAQGLALYHVTPFFPGVVKEKSSTVLGELYEVDNETLKSLDHLESNGYLYQREKFSVLIMEKGYVDAWVYVWLNGISGCKVPLEHQPWRKGKQKCS